MASGGMRERMPVVTAFVDQLREVFGREYIDNIIKAGMRGQPVFHATENGHTVGTPNIRLCVRIGKDARGNSIDLDNPDAPREPRRGGATVWQAALDQQELDNKKGQGDGTR